MKYIKLKNNDIIIFTAGNMVHKDFADKKDVKSAGHVYMNGTKVVCYGKSNGFDMYPEKGDANLIKKTLSLKEHHE